MLGISSLTKQGPLGPSSLTEDVGISPSALSRMMLLFSVWEFYPMHFPYQCSIQRLFEPHTWGKRERWFICDDIWPEPDLIVLAVGLLSNSCGSPDLTQAKCHMLHLQMGICSSRAASLPLQWTFSQWDRGVSTTLFKGRGNFWWKWI